MPQMSRSGGPNFLGAQFAPFVVPDDPNSDGFRVRDVAIPKALETTRFETRKDLRGVVDRLERIAAPAAGDPVTVLDDYYQQSYNLISSPDAQKAFDIHSEAPEVRDAYGRHSFGQRTLLARRLVEAGVPFITLYEGGWDNHGDLFNNLRKRLPKFTGTIAQLLLDLDQRGLLDSTLVIVLGEFGRTPKINKDAGRDHWPNVSCALLAGGGLRAGQVIGSTDRNGGEAKDRPVHFQEVMATLYHCLGLVPNTEIHDTLGRPIPICRGRVIREIL